MGKYVAPFVRSLYNYDPDVASAASGTLCEDESLTVQSEKDEADINTIVKRFGLTGHLPQDVRMPLEGDFTSVFDFQSAQNAIRAATESFNAMPAEVRSRFDNNPKHFVDFCTARTNDGKLANIDEMRELGLAVPEVVKVESAPMKVEVVNPPKKE